jgi:hypothetical protein
MNPNRSARNPQQVRSIIQNLGRSIDEARTRRLGPTTLAAPSDRGSRSVLDETVIGQPAAPERPGSQPSPGLPPAAPHRIESAPPSPVAHPPIRAAHEMFADGGPRLKARPKRAS